MAGDETGHGWFEETFGRDEGEDVKRHICACVVLYAVVKYHMRLSEELDVADKNLCHHSSQIKLVRSYFLDVALTILDSHVQFIEPDQLDSEQFPLSFQPAPRLVEHRDVGALSQHSRLIKICSYEPIIRTDRRMTARFR